MEGVKAKQKAKHMLHIDPFTPKQTSLGALSRSIQQLWFAQSFLKNRTKKTTGLQQLCAELLIRLNKPLLLETTAATNVVWTKELTAKVPQAK